MTFLLRLARNKTYTTALLALLCAFLTADQSLLSPNLSAAARDFGFSDKKRDLWLGGYLSAGFFAIGAPAAVLVGRLADSLDRPKLLLATVFLGAAPCIATYWVTTFGQLFALRMLTGISLGGSMPVFSSLMGDLYGTAHRLTANTVFMMAMVLGTGLGQILAGIIGPATNWRVPFVVVAVPTVLLAVLLVLTTQDPPRGAMEEAVQKLSKRQEGFHYKLQRGSWREAATAMLAPTNILVMLQNIPGNLPIASLMTFAADYLQQEGGLSVKAASTTMLGYTLGVAGGAAVGGFGGQLLYNRWKPYLGLVSGSACLLAAPPTFWLINTHLADSSWGAIGLACAIGGFFAGAPMAIGGVMVLNVCEPNMRGMVTGAQSVLGDLFSGVGPFMVALMINSMGRKGALNVSLAGWFPAGVLLLLTMCTIIPDEDRMQARLLEAASGGPAPLLSAPYGGSLELEMHHPPQEGIHSDPLLGPHSPRRRGASMRAMFSLTEGDMDVEAGAGEKEVLGGAGAARRSRGEEDAGRALLL